MFAQHSGSNEQLTDYYSHVKLTGTTGIKKVISLSYDKTLFSNTSIYI
jgi:hypothetical protein